MNRKGFLFLGLDFGAGLRRAVMGSRSVNAPRESFETSSSGSHSASDTQVDGYAELSGVLMLRGVVWPDAIAVGVDEVPMPRARAARRLFAARPLAILEDMLVDATKESTASG